MANPPITIAPFTNVPAPGSPIRSDWPQTISRYLSDAIIRNGIDGAVVANGRLDLAIGSTVVTTDSSGYSGIAYPFAFAAAPGAFVAMCGVDGRYLCVNTARNATSAVVRIFDLTPAGMPALANQTMRINWWVAGRRAQY